MSNTLNLVAYNQYEFIDAVFMNDPSTDWAIIEIDQKSCASLPLDMDLKVLPVWAKWEDN